jgi:glycosyltransferase involved in cell wall biosynthesis
MIILGLQETDWLTRGPHTQHHIFERLSLNPKIKITVYDYDIDKIMKSESLFVRKKKYVSKNKTIQNSRVLVIRSSHLQIPYVRRISSLFFNFFDILKFIRKNRPDLIVSFSLSNGLLGKFFAKLFRIPFIFYYIDLLHTLVPLGYVQNLAEIISRYLFKKSDRVIAVTKYLKDYIIHQGVPEENVKLVFNGISLDNTIINENKLTKLRSDLNISNDDFVLFFMGYLYDFAGLREIIENYHQFVVRGDLNLKFLIVGDGGIYNNLSNYVKSIGAEWVILTGRIPFFNITEYIAMADLCLMSFKLNEITRQITPIKVMEYMAMQKPVLSNSLPSVISEIGEEKGVIFAKNQKILIKTIAELYHRREKLKDFGKKGYDLIKTEYTWSRILDHLKKIMLNLIKEKRTKS